jgi:predicted nucleotidyltransferase
MVPVIANQLPALAEIFRRHHVVRADVFGSAVSGAFNAHSDIDLLVAFDDSIALLEYADNYFSLKEKLEELLGRSVDVVSGRSLKNPVIIDAIHRSKQLVYAA